MRDLLFAGLGSAATAVALFLSGIVTSDTPSPVVPVPLSPNISSVPANINCPAGFKEHDLGGGSGRGLIPDTGRGYLACNSPDNVYTLDIYSDGAMNLTKVTLPPAVITDREPGGKEQIDEVLKRYR